MLTTGTGNSLFIDAAIRRFGFCVELGWASLKLRLARLHGLEVATPKPVLLKAFDCT